MFATGVAHKVFLIPVVLPEVVLGWLGGNARQLGESGEQKEAGSRVLMGLNVASGGVNAMMQKKSHTDALNDKEKKPTSTTDGDHGTGGKSPLV